METASTSQFWDRWWRLTFRWWRAGPSNHPSVIARGLACGGASSISLIGELLQRSLDADPQLVALLTQQGRLGASSGQLMPEPLYFSLELLHSRIRSRRAFARLGQLHARAFKRDLQLAPLGEQFLDQGLSRLFRLFRHSGKVRAGTHAGGGAPSRRVDSAP